MPSNRCRVCGQPLHKNGSVQSSTGSTCARHYPPEHLMSHPKENIRAWAEDIYTNARSAIREMRFEKNPYFSLYMVHMAIEKMIKCVMLSRIGRFDHGHNLIILLTNAIQDEKPPQWILEYCSELNVYETAGKYPNEMVDVIRNTNQDFINEAISNMEKVLIWLSKRVN
ncbi:MAG: HEPN domain-containing protein [Bacilli bacterium]